MQKPTVAFSPCQGYGPELAEALETLLAHLGGWQTWIKPGQRVLIKPNLLGDLAPERAATTHPELVRHVIRSLIRYGAQVQVGDSPANAMDLQRVWQVTGMAKVCAEEKAPLIGFEQHATRQVSHGGHSFSVAEAVMSADLIVNLPKIKSHGLTTLTAAVKNFYGVLPGYQKTQLHASYPRPERFCRMLRSLHAILPPSISIADGVVGMEGDGPSNGQPVQLGFLAASADAVALDLAICQVLGIDPARVPFLTDSSGTLKSMPAFDWLGDVPSAPLPFRAPSGGGHILRLVPAPFLRLLKALVWIRPSFTSECRACGRCVVACPVKALNQAKGKIPKLRARRCIACCCCHEVCPAHAIRMRRSLLLRTFGVFRNLDA